MGTVAKDLLDRLHPVDPYQGFPVDEYAGDLPEGAENRILAQLMQELQPRLIIEVGSWKGATSIQLAAGLRRPSVDGAVVCVDTWLGSVEHWNGSASGWDVRPFLRHGYPTLYYQFLANIVRAACADLVVPVPNTSANAAKLLRGVGVTADLVYVDASHEEDDVYRDLCDYWRLLRPGGVLAGDDWMARWHGVICAVNRFARERQTPLHIDRTKWWLQKPSANRDPSS